MDSCRRSSWNFQASQLGVVTLVRPASSSFKHGFFNRTLNQVEMVLADGEVVTASPEERADLFHGAAGAVGTLGVTTMVELQLRKASKYVETTYHPVSSVREAIGLCKSFTENGSGYDYVDGIMFSQTQGAIVTGKMTDVVKEGVKVQRFSHPKDPWFYLYVQDRITKNGGPSTDAVPLPEYLFRYDRGGFWVGSAPFTYFKGVPFNDFTRWFLDDFLHTRMLYNALHGSGQSEMMIIQDLALPYETSEEFIKYTDDTLGIWPLWLCPLKQSASPTMHPHYNETEADGKTMRPMLNIGLWGQGAQGHSAFVAANKDIERKLKELRGMRWLYAQTYHSEEEFWQDFDKEWYDSLRQKYKATGMPSVWEKVYVKEQDDKARKSNSASMWPIPGLVGLRKAIKSKDYLLHRHAAWKDWVPR